MIRLWLCMIIGLAGCSAAKESNPETDAGNPEYYESSGTVFFISGNELEGVKQKALAGDNEQLQRLVDYYMFSHVPQDGTAKAELQKWQRLGAERGLEGAAYNMLYAANAEVGPDCLTLKKYSRSLPSNDVESLREHNRYVKDCLAE